MLNYNEIAVIDDGVNVAFYNNIPILNNSIEIDINCIVKQYINNDIEYSHGTVCASIISKYTKGAIMSSVKIINESNKTTGKQLIKAIEWCLEKRIGVVNLSLGSTDINEKDDICEIINSVVKYGMIIVAASSNNGKITYPASFSNVIGVKTLEQNKSEGYIYKCRTIDGVDILAPSIHKLTNCFEEEESQKCNSFAAPYITAQVHNRIKSLKVKFSPLDIKYMLLEKSINYEEIKDKNIINGGLEWINEAVTFNIVSNENHNVESAKYIFNNVEEKIIYEEDRNDLLEDIEAYMREVSLKNFDTIVIKDFNRKEFRVNFFVENLLKYNKGLVYINDLCKNQEKLRTVYKNNLYFMDRYKCLDYKSQKNINIDVPVILVAGEIKQGVAFILKLSELFKAGGYRCKLYSEMSIGELYGIDFLPLKSIYYKDKFKGEKIKELLSLSKVDLSIVFVDKNKLDRDYIKWLETTLENDIRIVMSSDLTEFFTSDEEKYNLILHSVGNLKGNINYKKNCYMVKNIEDAYKAIIEIYT